MNITRRNFGTSLLAGAGVLCVPSIALANDMPNWTLEDGVWLIKNKYHRRTPNTVHFNTFDLATVCGSPVKVNNYGKYIVLKDDSPLFELSYEKGYRWGFDDGVPRNWAYISHGDITNIPKLKEKWKIGIKMGASFHGINETAYEEKLRKFLSPELGSLIKIHRR